MIVCSDPIVYEGNILFCNNLAKGMIKIWNDFKKQIITTIAVALGTTIWGFIYRESIWRYFSNEFHWLFLIPFVISILFYASVYFFRQERNGKYYTFKNNFIHRYNMVLSLTLFILSVVSVWYIYDIWLPSRPLPDDKFVIAIARFIPIDDESRGYVNNFIDIFEGEINSKNIKNKSGVTIKVEELTESLKCQDSEDDNVRKEIEKLGRRNGANIVICGKIRSDFGQHYFEYHIIEAQEREILKDVPKNPIDLFDKKHSSNFTIEERISNDEKANMQGQKISEIGDFVRFLYGYANWSSNKKDIAKNIFASLKNKEQYFNGCYGYAENLYNKEQYSTAIPFLELSLAIDENNDKAWAELGNIYYNLGNYDEAISNYSKSIELNPENDYVYNNLGIAYYNLKNYNGALNAYNEALKLNPKYDSAYNNLGETYNDLGYYKEAINAYNKSIELDSKNDSVWNDLGIAYDNSNNYDEAIRAYKEAIKLNPKYDSAYNNLGVVYNTLRNYDEAIKDFNKSIELNLENKYAYGNLGDVYNTLKNYAEALKNYQKASELNSENYYFLNGLGDTYYNLGNYDDAVNAYNEALKLNPEYYAVWNDLGDAYYYGLENYDEAIIAYTRATELDNKNASYWNSLGNAYYYADNYDEAVKAYTVATELDKKNDSYWNSLGNAYDSLENYGEAKKAYNMAIRLNPKNDDAKKSLSVVQENMAE